MSNSACNPATPSPSNSSQSQTTQPLLLANGMTLIGKVAKPFVQDGKIMGVVVQFDGTHETALLHRKRVLGRNRDARLSAFTAGTQVTVQLEIFGPRRKIWASERDADGGFILDHLLRQRSNRIRGEVVNPTKYGVFVELQEGAAAGWKGLVHARNMKRSGQKVRTSQFRPGATIWVEVLTANFDDKENVRIDLRICDQA